MNEKSDIAALEAENKRLRAEVEANREKLRGLDDTIKASLYLLEDVNEAKAQLERAEKGLEEEAEITKHLLMIAQATSHTINTEKLMEQTLHCSREITGSDICLSYLWDSAERLFKPSRELGLPHGLIPSFRTEPLPEEELKKALLEGKPVMMQLGVRSDEFGVQAPNSQLPTPSSQLPTTGSRLFPWLRDINISTVGLIPLRGRKETIGLLAGIYFAPRELNEKTRRLMEGISNQLSTALEEARLYRESTERAIELSNKLETIKAMNEIDRSILSTLNGDEIMEIAIRMVAKVIPCDRAVIAVVDKERRGFINAAGFGVEFLQKKSFVPFRDTSTTGVFETMRPQYERNLAEAAELLPLEKQLLEKGFVSHIRVPLIVKEEVAGVLNIGSRRPSAFTPENLSTLEKMAAQVSVALENARLVSDLQELFLATVKSLSSAIDAKSKWTAGHSERVTSYALGIGKELGLSEEELKDIELAALLHDVGKIGTYESILDKPARLTDEELAVMRQHPVKGAEIIAPIKQLKGVIPAIRHHHEFYNGTGYPDGLKGEEIPFHARILAVADTYDAMKADRPYRTGRTMEFILEEFKRCSGTQFDPKVLGVFLKLMTGKP